MASTSIRVKFLASLAVLLLSSCGGGGSNPFSIGPTPPVAGQPATIVYISATPPVIATTFGVGIVKNTILRFIVRDGFGVAVANGTVVNFLLAGPSGGKQPSNGGEYIGSDDGTPTTWSTTTVGGVAEVNLVAGAVAGPATVTATVAGTGISAVSASVSIGGGIASSNHFLLAAQRVNLAAAPGNFTIIGAFLSDRWGNPRGLAGTVVSFFAEVGAIQPLTTVDEFGQAFADYTVGAGFPPNGIVTIMAAVNGEEAFVDQDGNGLYGIGEPFTDIAEPFLDKNENGIRDADELYIDVNGNGVYNGPNGLWDGPACPAIGCRNPATIWTSMTLTLSGNAVCSLSPGNGWTVLNSSSQPFMFTVQDVNGNSLVGGTTITVSKTGAGTLGGQLTATIPDGASGPAVVNFNLSDSDTDTDVAPASVTVTVTPPASSGVVGCVSTSSGFVQ